MKRRCCAFGIRQCHPTHQPTHPVPPAGGITLRDNEATQLTGSLCGTNAVARDVEPAAGRWGNVAKVLLRLEREMEYSPNRSIRNCEEALTTGLVCEECSCDDVDIPRPCTASART